MPISLTVAEFIADARIGATDAELDLATRRLAYATAAITQYLGAAYQTAPDVMLNPNPPMDRDGRGEDTGRGRGSNRRGWSGLEFG